MVWTPEARARQAERIRERKPWLKSTGPRTDEGKSISRMNALKSGASDDEMRQLEALVRAVLACCAKSE